MPIITSSRMQKWWALDGFTNGNDLQMLARHLPAEKRDIGRDQYSLLTMGKDGNMGMGSEWWNGIYDWIARGGYWPGGPNCRRTFKGSARTQKNCGRGQSSAVGKALEKNNVKKRVVGSKPRKRSGSPELKKKKKKEKKKG